MNSGQGTRMGTLTHNIPKCLVPVNDIPLLGRQLKSLQQLGITNIVITTGPYPEKIKEYVKNNFPDLTVEYVHNPRYKETNYIYSLYLAKELLNEDILLMHGDMVYEDAVLKLLMQNTSENAVLVNNTIPPPEKDFKGLIFNNRITKIGVNVFGEGCFFLAPIYKFSKKSFQHWMTEIDSFVQKNNLSVYAEDAFNAISHKVILTPVFFTDFCGEVDTPEDLIEAERYLGDIK